MTFGDALEAMKRGERVFRGGWNGKGMWLALVPASQWGVGSDVPFDWEAEGFDLLPWIGMSTADNKFVPWLASQTDMLADDWQTYA